MLKVLKKVFVIVIIISIIIVLGYCSIIRNKEKEVIVLYDGGNFKIVSYDDTTYIINYDIYGGMHEFKSDQSCGENKTSRTE